MRNKLIALMMLVSLSGCKLNTDVGPCVGMLDKDDPEMVYELAGWNVAGAVIFSASVVIPAIVVLKAYKCPVRKK